MIADNMALIADQIFDHYTEYAGLDILLGVLAFSIQIYGDFAGYSDIARGLSRLMGFELLVNFRLPTFAVNPSDFWSRWHISLSSWLRDYLYIPLGGNRGGTWKTYRNLLITMILGGLWHGAAWNFVIWGAYHGLILVLYRAFERRPVHREPWGGEHPYVIVILKMGIMSALTLVGWLIFRSTCVRQMIYMLTRFSLVPSAESMDFAFRLSFFSLPASVSLKERAEILLLRYVPLYSENVTLSKTILTGARSPGSLFRNRFHLQSSGYMKSMKSLPEWVEYDAWVHVKFVTENGFVVSDVNRSAMDRLIALADRYGINVYMATGPLYKSLYENEQFGRYFAQVRKELERFADSSEHIHYLPTVSTFPADQMQEADHVIYPAAEIYTDQVVQEIMQIGGGR